MPRRSSQRLPMKRWRAALAGVILTLPAHPLFVGALDDATAAAQLEAAGFTPLGLRETGNPDWLSLGFWFDPQSLRLRDLQARHDALVEEHRALQSQSAAWAAERDALEAEAARASEIWAAEKQVMTAQSTQAADAWAAEKEALQAQSTQAAMTARQLALRDSDLRDLQARYQEVMRDKAQLEQLLGAVTAKLHEGVRYIDMLEPEGALHHDPAVTDDTDGPE